MSVEEKIDGTKKKRRPWRNRVRKLAMKASKREQNATPALNSMKKEDAIAGRLSPTMTPTSARLRAARFRFINEQLYTRTGDDAFAMFQTDADAFDVYHAGYRDQSRKWPRNPIDTVIQWIQAIPPGASIADMGCGEGKLAGKVGHLHTVHSFDLLALNDRVTVCDMAKVPLEDRSMDVVVFCLSLMGTNTQDFIREANRILKLGGTMYIAEVCSRFASVRQFLRALTVMGFRCETQRALNDYFLLLKLKKTGKVREKRPPGLRLNPCLYKKR